MLMTPTPVRFSKAGGRTADPNETPHNRLFAAVSANTQLTLITKGGREEQLTAARDAARSFSQTELSLLHLKKQANAAYVDHVLSTAYDQRDKTELTVETDKVRKACDVEETDLLFGFHGLRKALGEPTDDMPEAVAMEVLKMKRTTMAASLIDFAKTDIPVDFENVDLTNVRKAHEAQIIAKIGLGRAKLKASAAAIEIATICDLIELNSGRMDRNGERIEKLSDGMDWQNSPVASAVDYAEMLVGQHKQEHITDDIKSLFADLNVAKANAAAWVAEIQNEGEALKEAMQAGVDAESSFMMWAMGETT